MRVNIPRRSFLNRGFSLGAGVLFLPELKRSISSEGRIPLIITSHNNRAGQEAVKAGYEILAEGGSALDAVEKGANIIELDPEDMSVGYGGAPNEHCMVQLDASIMDGRTYNAGAVACLENIKHPSSVARLVMEHTDHVLIVGSGALEFAKKWGFKEENLLTEKARKAWLRWRENLNDRDPWGPPEHLRGQKEIRTYLNTNHEEEFHHGTTNVLAIDAQGDIAGITSTSGLSWKIPGRVGDSPIIGAGLYVDNDVGAAGVIGRGEDIIKSCATFYIVLRMKDGRSPEEACMDALQMIVDKYRNVNPDYFPGEHFVAINKRGEVGCANMTGRARMSVMDGDGLRLVEGPGLRR